MTSIPENKAGQEFGDLDKGQYDNESLAVKPVKEDVLLKQYQKSLGVYPFIAFVIIGTTELVGWNGLLNSQVSIYAGIWGVAEAPVLHTALYSIFNAIGTFLAICYDNIFVRPLITQIGIGLTLFDAVLYAILPYVNPYTARKLMNFVGVTMGVSSCLIGCSAFGYANFFPKTYAGAMSAGLGVAGTVTFVFWLLATDVFFTNGTADHIAKANILLQAVAIVCSVFSFIFVYFFFKNPKVKYILARREKEKEEIQQRFKEGTATMEELLLLDRGPKAILTEIWDTFWHVKFLTLSVFITMFVTLLIFPGIGPIRWNASGPETDGLIGAYQVGDLIGRYIPNLVPMFMLNERDCHIFTAVRCILILTGMLTWAYNQSVYKGKLAIQIIQILLLAISNGWIMTAAMSLMPKKVNTAVAKARCGSIALLAIVFGISAGTWCCTLITSLYG